MLRILQLSVISMEKLKSGWPLEKFLDSVWSRIKYAEKTFGDLWGQSKIFEAIISNYLCLRRVKTF